MNKTHAVGLIALNDAIVAFGGTWSDSLLAGDIAPKLGCTELNALTQLLRATGHSEVATMWTETHAKGDEEGDDHYRIPREEEPVASCPYTVANAETFGIDVENMCQSHASDLIRNISDRQGIVVQMIRAEDLLKHCPDEILGIDAEFQEALCRNVQERLGWVEDAFDDWAKVGEIIQTVAAQNRYPTA